VLGCIDKRIITGKEDIIVIKIWHVRVSKYYPDGIKYSFVFIHNNKRYLGYDNAENKGCHKHYINLENGHDFEINVDETAPEKILRTFKSEISMITKSLYDKH
jgi:hypothetical protein